MRSSNSGSAINPTQTRSLNAWETQEIGRIELACRRQLTVAVALTQVRTVGIKGDAPKSCAPGSGKCGVPSRGKVPSVRLIERQDRVPGGQAR